MMDLWGKPLKPLPKPEKPKLEERLPKGMVRREVYDRTQFQQAFKKETGKK